MYLSGPLVLLMVIIVSLVFVEEASSLPIPEESSTQHLESKIIRVLPKDEADDDIFSAPTEVRNRERKPRTRGLTDFQTEKRDGKTLVLYEEIPQKER